MLGLVCCGLHDLAELIGYRVCFHILPASFLLDGLIGFGGDLLGLIEAPIEQSFGGIAKLVAIGA
ncbi:hypothetical protein X735_33040 [Mesorhizobium sp. L2C085B000]|nr:hypothetical protein X735_33040 [Mesorhizobium sp. L2C085B000]